MFLHQKQIANKDRHLAPRARSSRQADTSVTRISRPTKLARPHSAAPSADAPAGLGDFMDPGWVVMAGIAVFFAAAAAIIAWG